MTVKVDLSGIERKLSSQNFNFARRALGNQMLADMDKFVPADEYMLRQTGVVSSDGKTLVWSTPYAQAQFYGTNGRVAFSNYTTPGTGKRWDLKAKSLYVNDWLRVVKEALKV